MSRYKSFLKDSHQIEFPYTAMEESLTFLAMPMSLIFSDKVATFKILLDQKESRKWKMI